MSADYPAAHSMDTEWFAVDADGRIGLFETGEPGAVSRKNHINLRAVTENSFAVSSGQAISSVR